MSYTKNNLNSITLLLTILIFLCLCLIYIQIFSLVNLSYYNNSEIYSKQVPIEEQDEAMGLFNMDADGVNSLIWYTKIYDDQSNIITAEVQQETGEEATEQVNWQTQRQVIQANITSSWRIQIPKLNLDVHIEEGTTSDVLLEAVGHFEETTTWDGNVCLAAHNRGYLCNFFQNIKNLEIGDEIIYYTEQGKRVYKVQINKVILETDWTYIEETEDNRITLITCEENRPEYRRCIQAMLVADL